MIYKYNEFNEKVNYNKLKKIIPFLLLQYIPSDESRPVPNVENKSKYTIYLKDENSSDIITLKPGEVYNGRIDGIKHPTKGVYKVVDYVDEIFGVQVYDNDVKYGNLPTYVNDKLGGGHLSKSPDNNWYELFAK